MPARSSRPNEEDKLLNAVTRHTFWRLTVAGLLAVAGATHASARDMAVDYGRAQWSLDWQKVGGRQQAQTPGGRSQVAQRPAAEPRAECNEGNPAAGAACGCQIRAGRGSEGIPEQCAPLRAYVAMHEEWLGYAGY